MITYLADYIQTPEYHAVYFDGDLSYWGPGQLGCWNITRFFQATNGADRLRVWEFRYNRHDRDVPMVPFDHMDYWHDSGLLETAEHYS